VQGVLQKIRVMRRPEADKWPALLGMVKEEVGAGQRALVFVNTKRLAQVHAVSVDLLSVGYSIGRGCRLLYWCVQESALRTWPSVRGNPRSVVVHFVISRPPLDAEGMRHRCRSCSSVCATRGTPRTPSTATASSRSVRLRWRRSKPGARRFW